MKRYTDPAIRVILQPKDTNAHGTIFGGIILSYIDIAGAVAAHRAGIPRCVTVAMDRVVFHEPVFVGDLISLYAWPLKLGRTSITVHVEVQAERAGHIEAGGLQTTRVTEAQLVFVAVDQDNRPTNVEHLRPVVERMIAEGNIERTGI